MPIINYTTSIGYEKTIAEIQAKLVQAGATKFVTDYDNQVPVAVTFCLRVRDELFPYSLPVNYEAILQVMKNDPKVPRRLCTREQAIRVGWRITKVWIEAQLAFIESEMVTTAEVFLPYAVTKSGKTLYQEIAAGNIHIGKAIGAGAQ